VRLKKWGPTLFVFMFILGCAGSVKNLPVSNGEAKIPCCGADYQQNLQIKYLGVGGFLIQRGQDTVLTAPFFSNPSILRVGLWHIQADPARINAFLPPVEDVQAILVGHAHYDHLLDIPYIAQERAPQAQVYGSKTMKNILAAVLPTKRLTALNAKAATHEELGQWQYLPQGKLKAKTIRLMAIKSGHAPHLCLFGRRLCLKLYKGEVTQPLDRLPQTAWGWKEGQTLAYLIDFLGKNGSVDFRIHYQDAASSPPLGFPPPLVEPGDNKRVDVIILCVPGFNKVNGYPEEIIKKTQPRFVVLAHWENFFTPRKGDPADLQVVPGGTDPKAFIKRLPQGTQWLLPRPGAWLRFTAEQS
jgi:hypothetical protein